MIAASLATSSRPVITRCLPRRPRSTYLRRYPTRPPGSRRNRSSDNGGLAPYLRKSLATKIVARRDAHACVQVESIALDGDRALVGALVGAGPRAVLLRVVSRQGRDRPAPPRDASAGVGRGL